jgi:hypothetical protein
MDNYDLRWLVTTGIIGLTYKNDCAHQLKGSWAIGRGCVRSNSAGGLPLDPNNDPGRLASLISLRPGLLLRKS